MMINNVSNTTAVAATGYAYKATKAQTLEDAPRIDQIYVAGQPIDMAGHEALRKELAASGFNFRFHVVDVENGTSTRFIITPNGAWKTGLDGFSSRVDFEQAIPGVPETTLRGMEQVSMMLQHLQPEHDVMRFGFRHMLQNLQLGENVDTTCPQEALKNQLQSLTDAFGAVRADFDGDDHMKFSQAAFRILLGASGRIIASLARINLGERDAATLDMDEVKALHKQAQAQMTTFADHFLDNFGRLGTQGAFEVAWRQFVFAN